MRPKGLKAKSVIQDEKKIDNNEVPRRGSSPQKLSFQTRLNSPEAARFPGGNPIPQMQRAQVPQARPGKDQKSP